MIKSQKIFGNVARQEFKVVYTYIKLANKLCKICFGLRVVKRVSKLQTVRTLYHAYFQPLLSYGLIFWGNSANAKFIFRLQKRAIREP
jgi:hypothetical protein